MKKGHPLRHRKLAARSRESDRAARSPQVDQSRREAFARERVRRWGGPFRPPAFGGGAYMALAARHAEVAGVTAHRR